MNKTTNFCRLFVLSLVFWTMTGCDYLINLGLASPQVIEIEEIGAKTNNKNKDNPIRVQGKVEKIVPLLGSSAYELRDVTGSIWIVSKNNLPPVGEKITVEGIPQYQEIVVGSENLGSFYLEEIKQVVETEDSILPTTEDNYIPVDLKKKPTEKKQPIGN